MIRAGTVSAVLWGIHPWEPQVFLISVQKLCLAGGTVWFCLCACYTSLVPQVQDLKASGSPSPGEMLVPGCKPDWDAGYPPGPAGGKHLAQGLQRAACHRAAGGRQGALRV